MEMGGPDMSNFKHCPKCHLQTYDIVNDECRSCLYRDRWIKGPVQAFMFMCLVTVIIVGLLRW